MEKLTKAQKKIISLLKANPEAQVAMNKYSGTSHDLGLRRWCQWQR